MATRQEGQLEVIAACSVEALSANAIAERLDRLPQPTKALADRLAAAGDLDRIAHPRRANAWVYRASQPGLARLAAEAILLEPNTYVVLISDPVPSRVASALAGFVRAVPPSWMFRLHGKYRLMVAYRDSVLADALEKCLADVAAPQAAIVVRTDQIRFPSQA